jgi:lysophospholipid acyltransferase 1/2
MPNSYFNFSRAVLLICCVYLSLLHVYRQVYEYGSYTLDITGKFV